MNISHKNLWNNANVFMGIVYLCSIIYYCYISVNYFDIIKGIIALGIQLLSCLILTNNYKRSKDYLSPGFVFYFIFEVTVAYGSILVYINNEFLIHTIATSSDILNQDLEQYMWVMTFGILIFSLVYKNMEIVYNTSFKKTSIYNHNYRSELFKNYKLKWGIMMVGYAACIMVAGIRLYLQDDMLIVFQNLVSGDELGGVYRKSLTNSQYLGGRYFGQGYFNFIIYNILPFFALCLYAKFRLTRNTFLMYSILIVTLILLSAELKRWPLISMIGSFFLINIYLGKKSGFSNKFIYLTSAILLLYVSTVALGRNTGDVFNSILYRLFISQTQTGTYIFQLFPTYEEFAYGKIYLNNLAGILPGADLSYSTKLFDTIHSRIGGASHSSLAEAYSNFGIPGVVLICCLFGYMFINARISFGKHETDPAYLAHYIVYLIFVIPGIATGSIVTPFMQILSLKILLVILDIKGIDVRQK